VDALLKNCDDGAFLHVKHNLDLRNLSHPALAEQLRPLLAQRERSMATRHLAVSIARECAVQGVANLLADIALSDAETHDSRVAAAYAVADIGSDQDRNRLEPLLGASREVDPNDQLRGAALRAIYPGDEYDDSI
jgi:hypothetical protein